MNSKSAKSGPNLQYSAKPTTGSWRNQDLMMYEAKAGCCGPSPVAQKMIIASDI